MATVLDYESPRPPPSGGGRHALADAFAMGAAIGTFTAWCVQALLSGHVPDPPILGACSAVLAASIVAGAGGLLFFLATLIRVRYLQKVQPGRRWPAFSIGVVYGGATLASLAVPVDKFAWMLFAVLLAGGPVVAAAVLVRAENSSG